MVGFKEGYVDLELSDVEAFITETDSSFDLGEDILWTLSTVSTMSSKNILTLNMC